jgi:hypothetical protein
MGLYCSHDAFSGSYSAFNRLRSFVCKAAKGSWPPHCDRSLDPEMWYIDDAFSEEEHPGLWSFLSHSDCNGEFSPQTCAAVAKDLKALLPAMANMNVLDRGHNARNGGYVATVNKFIAGCQAAAAANEPLTFF